jgi:hypothetical protein
MKEHQSKFQNINLKDAGTKGDLEKDGTSEDGTSFSLIREVKKKKKNKCVMGRFGPKSSSIK